MLGGTAERGFFFVRCKPSACRGGSTHPTPEPRPPPQIACKPAFVASTRNGVRSQQQVPPFQGPPPRAGRPQVCRMEHHMHNEGRWARGEGLGELQQIAQKVRQKSRNQRGLFLGRIWCGIRCPAGRRRRSRRPTSAPSSPLPGTAAPRTACPAHVTPTVKWWQWRRH